MAGQARVIRFPGAAQPADRGEPRERSDEEIIARFAVFWPKASPVVRREITRIVRNEERRERERAARAAHDESARRVLDHLNAKRSDALAELGRRGSGFSPVDANLRLLRARLAEGYTESDLRAICSVKARQVVAGDWDLRWLRPATLFNAMKCAQYRAELGA